MLLTVRLSAGATTERLQAHRAAFAGQDADVQRGDGDSRYLFALGQNDTIDQPHQ